MDPDQTEARRKEIEANKVPQGPRWLWDWSWWAAIAGLAVVFGVASYLKAGGKIIW